MYPPPPVSKNHLAQEPTPGSAVEFSHHFFYWGSGFFMFLVDVGQRFNNKLFFTRDIMDDDAVPMHFNVPEPKPKPKPKPAPKATAALKPGPKGQHRQEFRMVYHRKKGFTSQPAEQ